jgi:hypothetical protein
MLILRDYEKYTKKANKVESLTNTRKQNNSEISHTKKDGFYDNENASAIPRINYTED